LNLGACLYQKRPFLRLINAGYRGCLTPMKGEREFPIRSVSARVDGCTMIAP
jgi:hypothetical protein